MSPTKFDEIYEGEFDYVWRSLRRLGVRDADLEDVCHETFVVVFRHLGDYDPTRPIRPWLFGIALRVASDYRRSARVRREVLLKPVETADPRSDVETEVARREAREIVVRALQALEMDRRAIFVMHEIDGIPIPEVARVLDVPVNTAYSRLRLARADFAQAVAKLPSVSKLDREAVG